MAERIGLKLLRVRNRLTQTEMAKKCGISMSAYCLIENGKRNGSLEFWNAVQREFNLTGDEIWAIQNGK